MSFGQLKVNVCKENRRPFLFLHSPNRVWYWSERRAGPVSRCPAGQEARVLRVVHVSGFQGCFPQSLAWVLTRDRNCKG